MPAWDLLDQPLVQRIAWTLVHFAWQGAAIAAVVWCTIGIFHTRTARARYAVSLFGLAAMLACPAITFLVLDSPRSGVTARDVTIRQPNLDGRLVFSTLRRAEQNVDPQPNAGRSLQEAKTARPVATFSTRVDDWRDRVTRHSSVLVLVWVTGVFVLSVRLLLGWTVIRRLRRNRQLVPKSVNSISRRLSEWFGFRRSIPVFASRHVAEAVVFGLWRPVVLLPAAWLTELPPAVLEAVLAHELAHIRRWDVWTNLLERVTETLLFYHPAVWWLCGRLRLERELCCDALAVSAIGEPVRYAEALEHVARKSVYPTTPVLATGFGGTQMRLLTRVRNVLGSDGPDLQLGRWSAGLVALAIPVLLWAVAASMSPRATADDAETTLLAADDEGEEREGDREREEADRERREGDAERREGDRERREGDAERREGDRERRDPPRGEREGERREGDRPGPFGRGPRPPLRDGDRPTGPRGEGDRPRGFGPPPIRGEQAELARLVQQLRAEVEELRREVRELREQRGPGLQFRGEGSRRIGPPEGRPGFPGRRPFDRPDAAPRDRGGEREPGDRDREEGDARRDRPERERDTEREDRPRGDREDDDGDDDDRREGEQDRGERDDD